jgi:hypothetical protein
VLAVAAALIAAVSLTAQSPPSRPGASAYTAPLTPWGDPDHQGYYTNSEESQIPMERPASLEGRRLEDVTPEELARLID